MHDAVNAVIAPTAKAFFINPEILEKVLEKEFSVLFKVLLTCLSKALLFKDASTNISPTFLH